MNITVVGSGYVGLVAGACFAETGNDVVCVDVDEKKIEGLKKGIIPIYEPGLDDLVVRNSREGRLKFTTSLKDGVESAKVIFIAVGTPQDEDGSADLTYVLKVANGIGTYMNGPKIVVDKSTVPVGTAEKVKAEITKLTKHPVEVVSNPEFLKEGAALDDFMKPDRVVVGVASEEAAKVMKELYAPFVRTNNPILVMDVVSAEMTKYAANAMLATRVSFMNEIALLCEKVGADVENVRRGIATDSRIGTRFLFPGIGYGGSCFPKDVRALICTARENGLDFMISQAVEKVNERQKTVLGAKIVKHYGGKLAGKTFAVWGLAFKPKTDDVRDAPAMVVCDDILKAGGKIQAFDPEAMETFKRGFGERAGLTYAKSSLEALQGADALVICTEWNEFRHPNVQRMKELMKGSVIFDGRNVYEPQAIRNDGFTYFCMGRGKA